MGTLLTRTFKRLAQRHFGIAKAYHRLQLLCAPEQRYAPILVYQMGKVGSTTILHSLHAHRLHVPVHHVHMLTPAAIARFERFVKESFTCDLVTASQRATMVKHLVAVQHLRQQLDRQEHGLRWKVITLVRDPVARNLSSFFEILDPEMHYGLAAQLQAKGPDRAVEELCSLFLDAYPDHDLPLTFFDIELKPALGLDVFASPFPTSRGYEIYAGEHADTLLIRTENLAQCAPEAFAEFLGLQKFTITNANVGDNKSYAGIYRRVLDTINLPETYLRKMYDSKYASHFYSRNEIEAFQAKWRRRVRL